MYGVHSVGLSVAWPLKDNKPKQRGCRDLGGTRLPAYCLLFEKIPPPNQVL